MMMTGIEVHLAALASPIGLLQFLPGPNSSTPMMAGAMAHAPASIRRPAQQQVVMHARYHIVAAATLLRCRDSSGDSGRAGKINIQKTW
jgi:hypothetical protein